jgi:catechol 2,3-dioxygenase-like lactoylglutathione lyase family enzyme
MNIENMGAVTVDVKNLDEAIKRFSDVLGIKFVKLGGSGKLKSVTQEADHAFEENETNIAIDETGYLELMESKPPVAAEGLRSIHFKVSDIEQATEELKGKGMHLVASVTDPCGFKEAIFAAEDLHGVRLCLTEYSGSSVVNVLRK